MCCAFMPYTLLNSQNVSATDVTYRLRALLCITNDVVIIEMVQVDNPLVEVWIIQFLFYDQW